VRDLNAVYRHHPALHRQDRAAQGFAWLSADDAEQSVMAFERHSGSGETVVVIGNFTPVVRHEFRLGMPQVGRWKELINSDNDVYGGSGVGNPVLTTEPIAAHGRDCSVRMTLPPLAVLIWTRDADPS
jgi:1,4-alpha-glucan branching enzyme